MNVRFDKRDIRAQLAPHVIAALQIIASKQNDVADFNLMNMIKIVFTMSSLQELSLKETWVIHLCEECRACNSHSNSSHCSKIVHFAFHFPQRIRLLTTLPLESNTIYEYIYKIQIGFWNQRKHCFYVTRSAVEVEIEFLFEYNTQHLSNNEQICKSIGICNRRIYGTFEMYLFIFFVHNFLWQEINCHTGLRLYRSHFYHHEQNYLLTTRRLCAKQYRTS